MTQDINRPRVTDNGRGAVLVTFEGRQIRGWSYQSDDERVLKMKYAREFIEGWLAGKDYGLRKLFLPS